MDEILTIHEINARYAPDWVLIGEPQTDEFQHLLAGKVLFHSPDREEVYRKAIELRPGRFAFRYLGELPEDMALILSFAMSSERAIVGASPPSAVFRSRFPWMTQSTSMPPSTGR